MKKLVILTFCLLLGITFTSIPIYANDSVFNENVATSNTDPVDVTNINCSPWNYEYSYYICRNNNTYLVDVYSRVCNGKTETWHDENLSHPGICPYGVPAA